MSSLARTIDSHHHVWDPATRTYPWMPDGVLNQRFGPEDLKPLLDANGIEGSVLVQTVGDIEETREFLALAEANPFIIGVVGWADLTDAHLASDVTSLKEGVGGRKLVGIRHQVHDEENPDWLLLQEVQDGLNVLAEHNLVYDLLVRTRELPSAITVARDFPHLKFVVDHIAKPPIASGEIDEWATQMREFAGLDNVACKLSGMVTEANPDGWTIEDLTPYVQTVLEIFGPYRLMFGSDWPVCLLAASYDEVVSAARTILGNLGVSSEEELNAIFGGTASHWYSLEGPANG